jgi:hypothetical protein
MSDPQNTRPEADNPWFKRESVWAAVTSTIAVWSAFLVALPAIPEGRWHDTLVTAAALTALSSTLGRIQSLFVRSGLNGAKRQIQATEQKTAEVERKAVVAEQKVAAVAEKVAKGESGFTADLLGNPPPTTLTSAPPSTLLPGSQAEDRTGRLEPLPPRDFGPRGDS